jgi:hypothetical protein
MEFLAIAALLVAAAALWNSHATLQRVKRLEDRTGNRIEGEKYSEAFKGSPETR